MRHIELSRRDSVLIKIGAQNCQFNAANFPNFAVWCYRIYYGAMKNLLKHTQKHIASATKCWNTKHNSFTHWSTGAKNGYTPPLNHVR